MSIETGSIPSKWRARSVDVGVISPHTRAIPRRISGSTTGESLRGSMVVQRHFIRPGLSVNFCEWTGWPSRAALVGVRACGIYRIYSFPACRANLSVGFDEFAYPAVHSRRDLCSSEATKHKKKKHNKNIYKIFFHISWDNNFKSNIQYRYS